MMKTGKTILGLLLTIFLFYLLFSKAAFPLFFKTIKTIHIPLLLCSVVIFLIGYIIKAYRWVFLLKPIYPNISIKYAAPAFYISFAANNLLPFRAGELIRAIAIGYKIKISKSSALATVFIERVIDGIVLLLFLAVCLSFMQFPDWANRIGFLAMALFFFLSVGVFLAVTQRPLFIKIINLVCSIFTKKMSSFIHRMSDSFIHGFSIVRKVKILGLVFILSICVWLCEALMYYFLALSFDIHLSFPKFIFILSIVNFGIIIPAGPGYLGTFEFFCVKSMAVFGISVSMALSYAFVLHVAQFLPTTTIGLIFLWKEGLSLKMLTKTTGIK